MTQFRHAALAVSLFGLLGISCAPAMATTNSLTITMTPLNNSMEGGTAVLTQTTEGVKIVVKLTNAPSTAQPTHIHIGTCSSITKSPEYSLVSVTNGTSTSVLPGVSLDQLLKGHYAINVHKSATDLETYVSCANIE